MAADYSIDEPNEQTRQKFLIQHTHIGDLAQKGNQCKDISVKMQIETQCSEGYFSQMHMPNMANYAVGASKQTLAFCLLSIINFQHH